MGSGVSVDIAAMAYPDDLDHEPVVDDFVHDPVVAYTHPVRRWFAGEFDAARRTWLARQQVDRCSNPELVSAFEPGDRLDRPAGDFDRVLVHRCSGSLEPERSLDLFPRHVVILGSGRVEFATVLGLIGAVDESVERVGAQNHCDSTAAPRHRDWFAGLAGLGDHVGQTVPCVAECDLSHVQIVHIECR